MFKMTVLLSASIIFLQACGVSSVKNDTPNITSIPSGARVYANGLELGVTPLITDLFKAFPASWSDWKLSATGVLLLKKNGCEDYTLKVNDAVLAKPVYAKLKCSGRPVAGKPVPTKDMQLSAPSHMPAKKKSSGIEKRLNELGRLYKKGLITNEEYKASRKRILGEL